MRQDAGESLAMSCNYRPVKYLMKNVTFVSVIILFFASAVWAQKCAIDSGGPRHVPCANELITYDLGRIGKISGVVTDPVGARLDNVRLALFRIDGDAETFVGASEGDGKGRFCIPGLPKGKYILYIGEGNQPFSGFKCVKLTLTLLPKSYGASQNKIRIRLELGT
jgi:hypothetical protein